MQNQSIAQPRGSDRRRLDWQQNDRRQITPWVMDSNDRRTGEDRRVLERRREIAAAQEAETAHRAN